MQYTLVVGRITRRTPIYDLPITLHLCLSLGQ